MYLQAVITMDTITTVIILIIIITTIGTAQAGTGAFTLIMKGITGATVEMAGDMVLAIGMAAIGTAVTVADIMAAAVGMAADTITINPISV